MFYKDILIKKNEWDQMFSEKGNYILWNHQYWTIEFNITEYCFEEKKTDLGRSEIEFQFALESKEDYYLWKELELFWKKKLNFENDLKNKNIIWLDMTHPEKIGWLRLQIPRTKNLWLLSNHIETNYEKMDYCHLNVLMKKPWEKIQLSLEWSGYKDWKKILNHSWKYLQWKWLYWKGFYTVNEENSNEQKNNLEVSEN